MKINKKMNYKLFKINGCRLERQGDMPFELYAGSCGNYILDGQDIALLCFDYYDRTNCHT